MKQKTCKVAKTVLTLLLCAGLTAGSVPIDALAADVQSEQPVGGTETDTEAIDQTAKDTDQQCIISDRLTGNNIRKQTGKHDHTDRTYGKFLSDKFQTNKYRNRVQQYINQRIRNCNPHKCLKNVLEQQSKSCKSSRKKTACTNKCLNIQRHDRCSQNRTAVTLSFMF